MTGRWSFLTPWLVLKSIGLAFLIYYGSLAFALSCYWSYHR